MTNTETCHQSQFLWPEMLEVYSLYPLICPRVLSFAPLVACWRFFQLQDSGVLGRGHAEGQTGRGVDSRVTEVKARGAGASEP